MRISPAFSRMRCRKDRKRRNPRNPRKHRKLCNLHKRRKCRNLRKCRSFRNLHKAHVPPPAPAAHPAAPLAVEAPVAPAPAASHDELPPPGNDQARPRPDLGDSSDSDVEMLCFIPAPKRARARGVKQERPEHLHLPLQAPPRVKLEALYCRQGHALVFETPPPEVVLNEQQIATVRIFSDHV